MYLVQGVMGRLSHPPIVARAGLSCALLLLALASAAVTYAAAAPPSAGGHRLQDDWIVNGAEIVEDRDLLLGGNLIVESGGALTLRRTRLALDGTYDGQFGIRVRPGGAITIEDHTILTATLDTAHYPFVLEEGGHFLMRDSALHGCGWGVPYPSIGQETLGLTIYADDPIIHHSRLTGNFSGVRLFNGSGGSIVGNTIEDNIWSGIDLLGWTGVVVTDNTIADSYNGLALGGGSDGNLFQHNHFGRHYEGAMWMFDGWDNQFVENDVVDSGGVHIAHRSGNNRIVGNTFSDTSGNAISLYQSRNHLIQGNVINGSAQWGILLAYASDTIVAGNILTDSGEFAAIYLRHASRNTIVNNRIHNPADGDWHSLNGLLVWAGSMTNTIAANEISGATRGIALHYAADQNTIISNTISGSWQQAILVETSRGNTLHHNNWIDSGELPYDDTGANAWDDGQEGNYWSDHAGDGPCAIAPLGVDRHPLAAPSPASAAPVPPFTPVPRPPGPYRPSWIITGPVTLDHQDVVLEAGLEIHAGGSLTLSHATLAMTGTVPSIQIRAGGALYTLSSTIAPPRPEDGGWLFVVEPGAKLVIRDSTISGVGLWPGSGDWAAITVYTADVLLQDSIPADCSGGINLTGAGGRLIGSRVTECGHCITLDDASGLRLEGNTVDRALWTGIGISGSSHTVLSNTVAHDWETAISSHVQDSLFRGNWVSGSLDGWTVSGTGNRFEGNTLEGISRHGWPVWNAYDNLFAGNTITNSHSGMGFADTTGRNQIYHNNFWAVSPSNDHGQGNQWDDGRLGNYWADYDGLDLNGDGIGDSPYRVIATGVDRYPLMQPYRPPSPAVPFYLPLVLRRS